ncbi:unnamed protein product, partial [Polarella glacialis]
VHYVFAPAFVLGVCCTGLDGATRVIVLRGLLAVMLAAHAICQPAWLQSAKSLLKRCLSRSADVDGDSVRVDAMMGQLKVSNAKAAVAIFMHVMPPLSLFTACVSYLFQSGSPLHDSTSHFHMTLLGYATVGVATAMQESMSPRSCELGMLFTNIAVAIFTMACVPADHWFVASPIRLAVRILIGIGSMNHRHVALLNVAYIASYGYGNFASAQQVPGMQAGYGTVAECVLPEVVTSVFVWAILYFVESEVKKSLRASIHVVSAQNEISAFQAMLNIFCDAQAELDGDLRILSSDSKLSRLLRTTEELQNVQLVNYVADSDKPRVLDLIKTSNTQLASSSDPFAVLHSTAHMLHAQMLSASGESFGVQIFHVCRRDVHGSLRHLIGLCDELRRPPEEIDEHFIQASKAAWESKKQEEKQQPHHPPGKITVEQQQVQQQLTRAAFAAPGQQSRSKHSSSSASSSNASGGRQGMPGLQRISLALNQERDGFPIEECTFVFETGESGPLASSPTMEDWLLASAHDLFLSLLSDFDAAVSNGASSAPASFPLKFRMPGSDKLCLIADEGTMSLGGQARCIRLDLCGFAGYEIRSSGRKKSRPPSAPSRGTPARTHKNNKNNNNNNNNNSGSQGFQQQEQQQKQQQQQQQQRLPGRAERASEALKRAIRSPPSCCCCCWWWWCCCCCCCCCCCYCCCCCCCWWFWWCCCCCCWWWWCRCCYCCCCYYCCCYCCCCYC